jgi:ketosteroid isomerase-like protein
MHNFEPNTHARRGRKVVLLLCLALAAGGSTLQAALHQAGSPHPGMPRAQKHESRREIDLLEETWREAALKGNATALEPLLADDYMAITSAGTLQTKEQALENVRTGRTRFSSIIYSERKVRFYGTTALVTSVAEVTGETADGALSGSYRYTRVYVRDEKGQWKIVSFEANRISNIDDRKF